MRPNPAAASIDTGDLHVCPAGTPLGELELNVTSRAGDKPLPMQTILRLTEGDTLRYTPIDRGSSKRTGEVALVLVPSKISSKPKAEELFVEEPRSADKPQQWNIESSTALAVFVYSPQGVSRHRIQEFLAKDPTLVAQLAEYADKTTQTEALLAALNNKESSSASVNAALSGFASQYGVSTQIDKTAPPAVQAQALFSAINPQLSQYSPLANDAAGRAQQTAGLATAAASLFFGSPVGLLAGGTSMLLDFRSIVFPDTQFRSSYALMRKDSHMDLCGEQANASGHVRTAYLWATRIPDVPAPALKIGDANYLVAGQKTPVPIELPDPAWKYLQRGRDWNLEDAAAAHRYPIELLKLQNQKSIELNLAHAGAPPGVYHLAGSWDWAHFTTAGEIHVVAPVDFSHATLQAASRDRLMAGAGKTLVTVEGSDFEFVTAVKIKSTQDDFAVEHPVSFRLPKGLRRGPQTEMELQVDTTDLTPGPYQLLLSQASLEEEKPHPVPLRLLPESPLITNLPILTNAGSGPQLFVIKGRRLNGLERLEAPGVRIELVASETDTASRSVTVTVDGSLPPGTKIPVKAYVKDRSEPLTLPEALEISGPLPVIAGSRLQPPAGLAVTLKPEEIAAGWPLSGTLDVRNLQSQSTMKLSCGGEDDPALTLAVGQRTAKDSLQRLAKDQLYLLLDTASLPAGCQLQAVINNGRAGQSQPYTLGHIILVPTIEAIDPVPGTSGYQLRGRNLESIAKAGWNAEAAVAVEQLPVPIPGEGQRQTLTVLLGAPPAGKDQLFLWLRGDAEPRTTTWRNSAQAGSPISAASGQAHAASRQP